MNKTANYSIIFLTFVLLQACRSIAEPQPEPDVEEKRLIGHYIYGHEVNSFQPCAKKEVFWVKGTHQTLEFMKGKYTDYAVQPYEEVFVEIIAEFKSKATDGFAMDYDGQVYVMEMLVMNKKSDTDCK
jgi:hypothetical protein